MTQLGFQILNAGAARDPRERAALDFGPTHAIFDCRPGSQAEVLETMERLANEVWPKLRAGR